MLKLEPVSSAVKKYQKSQLLREPIGVVTVAAGVQINPHELVFAGKKDMTDSLDVNCISECAGRAGDALNEAYICDFFFF